MLSTSMASLNTQTQLGSKQQSEYSKDHTHVQNVDCITWDQARVCVCVFMCLCVCVVPLEMGIPIGSITWMFTSMSCIPAWLCMDVCLS